MLMRVTSKHLQALERQVRESINIEKCSRVAEECLNLKNEWAGSKIPGIRVSKPKGTATTKADLKGEESTSILQTALRRGCKRMEYVADDSCPEEREEGSKR